MKNYSSKLKIWECAALMALSITLCAGAWAQALQTSISAGLIRLHVIAASDEAREQNIKLKVRDEIIEYLSPILKNAEDSEEARQLIKENAAGIQKAAEKAACGREVRLSLGYEAYPTKSYEGFTLPAGSYDSLRVILGPGEGKNWWCIVFPPLCLEASQASRVQKVMSRDDYGLISEQEGYELRFKLVELWGELLNTAKAMN